jgi:hypothetical protein
VTKRDDGADVGSSQGEGSIPGALQPERRPEAAATDTPPSILGEITRIRDHIETLEEAARMARSLEFDQVRTVVEQLEAVAKAARAVEHDLSQELADTNRLSVATARLVRERLARTLRALDEALGIAGRGG